ncbi:hypothetical protein EK904_006199 [Melospiza melodia maxima]|nr:hypothetical protein EK904_006199 [Melospiza melodia maxima]
MLAIKACTCNNERSILYYYSIKMCMNLSILPFLAVSVAEVRRHHTRVLLALFCCGQESTADFVEVQHRRTESVCSIARWSCLSLWFRGTLCAEGDSDTLRDRLAFLLSPVCSLSTAGYLR